LLLAQLEDYYDSAPRDRSRVEEVGPFTLSWPSRVGPTTRGPGWVGLERLDHRRRALNHRRRALDHRRRARNHR